MSLNGLDSNSIDKVAKALRNARCLEFFDISGGPSCIPVDEASHIASIPGVEYGASNYAGLAGGLAIAQMLENMPNMKHVAIRHAGLSNTSFEPIAKSLQSCLNLEYIDVSGNNIEAFGGMCLSKVPTACPKLRYIDASHNPLTDRGVAALAHALQRSQSLESLHLGNV